MPNVTPIDFSPFDFDSYSPYLDCPELGTRLYFPSMPESYEIARENDFESDKIPLFPDGFIAIYKGCDPIHIPISFVVHANSPRCDQGPITLINAGKALHAMALPGIPDDAIGTLTTAGVINRSSGERFLAKGGQSTFASANASDFTATPASGSAGNDSKNYYMPPMVQLFMFESSADGTSGGTSAGTGVNMKGYLKGVKTTQRGPWLKAQGFGGRLPSSMEYSFTFVFFPAYTSTPTLGYKAATSTGGRVKLYFFGSNAVVTAQSSTFSGAAVQSGTPTAASVPPPPAANGGSGGSTAPLTVIPGRS